MLYYRLTKHLFECYNFLWCTTTFGLSFNPSGLFLEISSVTNARQVSQRAQFEVGYKVEIYAPVHFLEQSTHENNGVDE